MLALRKNGLHNQGYTQYNLQLIAYQHVSANPLTCLLLIALIYPLTDTMARDSGG